MRRHQPIYRFYNKLNNYKVRLIYNVTNNDIKRHVHGSASASLTMNNSTLTINSIACGAISCTGSTTQPTQPTVAGVYIRLDSAAAGGMEICCSASAYIDFTTINSDFRGRLIYTHSDNSFNWQVGGTTAVAMNLISTGLSVTGTVTSSDNILEINARKSIN